VSVAAGPPAGFVRHVHRGEFASAASAAVLFGLMVTVAWFGVNQPPGKANGAERVTTETGWDGLTIVRWLMLLTIAAAIGSLLLHVSQRSHGVSTDTHAAVTVLGALTAIALTIRVLIDLPSAASVVDQKLGAYLGLLAAYGIALGGYHALRESRAQSRAPAGREAPDEPGLAGQP
jgi:hypothetical protein